MASSEGPVPTARTSRCDDEAVPAAALPLSVFQAQRILQRRPPGLAGSGRPTVGTDHRARGCETVIL
jgi:hypothetical protein